MPAAPLHPPAAALDRFATCQRFGDVNVHDTRPVPLVAFRNGRATTVDNRKLKLSPRLQLPSCIYFYIRVKFQRVSFPFPPSVLAKYLLKARVVAGREDEGAVCRVPFDVEHGGTPRHHQTLCNTYTHQSNPLALTVCVSHWSTSASNGHILSTCAGGP